MFIVYYIGISHVWTLLQDLEQRWCVFSDIQQLVGTRKAKEGNGKMMKEDERGGSDSGTVERSGGVAAFL